MSIQDDIFDVNDRLKESLVITATFERICQWAFDMEDQIKVLEEREKQLITTIKVLKVI